MQKVPALRTDTFSRNKIPINSRNPGARTENGTAKSPRTLGHPDMIFNVEEHISHKTQDERRLRTEPFRHK